MTETEIKNIFPEELKIDPEKGFDEHDIFGWKRQGEGLIDLLNSTTQQMVLGLDAPWGSGKTTFLQMLAGELKKTNGKNSVIYFDAFEVDYMDDPFIPLAGELSAHIEEQEGIDKKIKDKFTKSATHVGKGLIKGAVKIGVKAATLNSIDIDEVEEDIANVLAKSATSVLDQEVEASIKAYKEKKSAVNALKSSLSEIAEVLTEGDKPLIFIIDELDRCKPDFALRILEQIKHLFSTPNVHFILSADYKQMGAMVRKAYGTDYDAEKYFHKFIQNTFSLKYEDPVPKYIELFCRNTVLKSMPEETITLLITYLTSLQKKYQFSLRELERILISLSFMHKQIDELAFDDAVFVGLAVMKVIKKNLFMKIKEEGTSSDEIQSFFGITDTVFDPSTEPHEIVYFQIWTAIYFNMKFTHYSEVYYEEQFIDFKRGITYNTQLSELRIRNICNRLMLCE